VTKILVVEDNEAVGQMLVKALTMKKYEARWAATGEEALAASKELVPDIVLMDMHLPDAEGTDLAKQIKKDPKTKAAKIVVLSGDPLPPEKQKGLDGFLIKPVALGKLLETVKGLA
jgi:two-component system phosphate regulon response regulator PhoB